VRHVPSGDADLVDEIVTLKVRGDVTQSYLLASEGGTRPQVVALMFPGGAGVVGLPTDVNRLRLGSNFLVRTRDLFRDSEVAVAILDAPSDQSLGMSDGFRTGKEHSLDVGVVVNDLRARFPTAKLFLVGTSRGTVSAAYVGRTLGARIDGVVLSSTVFLPNRNGVGGALHAFEFESIPAPLLFVHHAEDRCELCPYSWARELGRKHPLITVRGGGKALSGECDALSAHGYIGKEAETVAAIKNWMLGRPYPSVIE